MNDALEVIRSQILNAISANIIVKPVHAGVFRPPMNLQVRTKTFVAVELAVKTNPGLSVIWISEVKDDVQSAVGCLQIYSDKSQNS